MSNRSKIGWGVVVVIIITLGMWFANTDSKSVAKISKIGMITILSGEYATVGENFRNGALLASEEYNIAHPDNKIEFIVEDDGFDSKKALSAYQKLTGIDGIDALINTSTPSIAAIYELVTKLTMPVIQAGEQPVEPTADNVFQILPGNIDAEKVLGALFLILLPEILRFVGFPSDIAAQMRVLVYGVLLVILMLYRPQGLLGEYKL